jgi:phosphoglycerate dehydrogenase-like enzyme
MSATAVAVNIGRGVVVDTDALIESLESGHLGGAGLDVTDPEPLPDGHKLWTTKNVIITPHIAGLTTKYLTRSIDMLVANAERLKKGENLLNTVDLAKGY